MGRAASDQRDRRAGQISLFDQLEPASAGGTDEGLPGVEAWPQSQNLAGEKELLGFYISGHPLAAMRGDIARYSLHSLPELREAADQTQTRVAGLVTQFTKRFTKKDQKAMGVFRLETMEGTIEAVVFPAVYEQYAVHLREEAPVLVCADLAREGDQARLRVNEVYPLGDAHRYFAEKVSLHIPEARMTDDVVREVRQILRSHPGDVTVTVCVELQSGEKIFIKAEHTFKTTATAALVHELDNLLADKLGGRGTAPELKPLAAIADGVASFLPADAAAEGGADAAGAAEGATGGSSDGAARRGWPGGVHSREEAIRAIDMVCGYLERAEPTNPAQLYLRRGRQLLTHNFLQLMKVLAPDALSEVARIVGVDPDTVEPPGGP